MKRKKPEAYCTRCGYITGITAVNNSCPKCRKGVIRSAIGSNDWQECSICDANGYVDGKKCSSCYGNGWILMRGLR